MSKQVSDSTKSHQDLVRSTVKSSQKRFKRYGILASNVIVLGIIVFFVSANTNVSNKPVSLNNNSAPVAASNPLDQVSGADIALTVAQMTNMPEATAVANQAQSADADVAMTATANPVVAKPEVVATALKSKADIVYYTAAAGDNVNTLATKFGITSNSIIGSNSLSNNSITAGTKLLIPPVNGIVYVVQAGDTPASLAAKYKANEAQIIAYNDAEINGLTPGEHIIIPSAILPTGFSTTASTNSLTLTTQTPSGTSASGFPWGTGPIYGYNGYDFGYCTWYVATQVSVPSNWGNAATWAYYAGMSGYNVSYTPTVGAIAQTADAAGGEGHVAVVDAVNGNMIQIRDMNGVAGWDRVGYSAWIPASTFQHFITK